MILLAPNHQVGNTKVETLEIIKQYAKLFKVSFRRHLLYSILRTLFLSFEAYLQKALKDKTKT